MANSNKTKKYFGDFNIGGFLRTSIDEESFLDLFDEMSSSVMLTVVGADGTKLEIDVSDFSVDWYDSDNL